MKMTDAEKKAFILGMVSRNMPILQTGTNDGFIDYLTDTVDARLGLRQYIEDVFGSIFDFCKFVTDNVDLNIALRLNGTGGVGDSISSSMFNFTSKVKDTLGISSEVSGSPFVMDTDGVTLVNYTGSSPYVSLPDNVKRIAGTAFSGVKDTLRYIDFNKVEFISNDAFSGYSKLTSVMFSGTQRCEIGSSCFKDCVQLNCEIPKNIYRFGDMCFMGCSGLTGVLDLQSSIWRLNYIGNKAFAGTGFDTVKIPYMFDGVWDGAFADMSQLSTVELDSRIYKLPVRVFENSAGLLVKGFTSGITIYSERCFYNSGLTGNISIVNSEELPVSIEDYAFANCKNITGLYIDRYVQYIGDSAFLGCSGIETLELGEGVSTLSNNCFSGLVNLAYVKLPITIAGLDDAIFSGCVNLLTIEAPEHLRTFEDVLTGGNNATVIYY